MSNDELDDLLGNIAAIRRQLAYILILLWSMLVALALFTGGLAIWKAVAE